MKGNQKTNFILDLLLLVLLAAMAGVGFLMKWVLVPGFKITEIYHTNQGELYYLGLDRHEWGTIHLIISLVFLAVLILHILFHWTQILCLFRRYIPGKGSRIIVTSLLLLGSFVLFVFPLFINPVLGEKEHRGYNNRQRELSSEEHLHSMDATAGQVQTEAPEPVQVTEEIPLRKNQNTPPGETHPPTMKAGLEHEEEYAHEGISDIAGYQSLEEICTQFGVPEKGVREHLGIPAEASAAQNLGRLKRAYGFELQDLRQYIDQYLLEKK